MEALSISANLYYGIPYDALLLAHSGRAVLSAEVTVGRLSGKYWDPADSSYLADGQAHDFTSLTMLLFPGCMVYLGRPS